MSAAAAGPGGDAGALNYTVLIPITYNASDPTGGNSLVENLNVHYEVCTSTVSMLDSETDTDIFSLVISHGCSPRRRWCC